ncbi:phosphoglucomutase/phosphomannomutase family protein [Halapricum salinum]|uniref:Phosphoglucomutase/phosphomannomutase family protein n=1 Tax=Halapricum salinum TaxID=1457250 RepID=A0A4D6H9L2_9EURY|nr:phosphoglucomutase/phosphomannomutase family protein [Halapricum salinum]QCC50754.1 phosphoglucomutase/phosphomannomutase family protein [Halapricum salinum]
MGDDADAITFGTDGWRATLDVFTEPRVRMVGQAVATYLEETGQDAPVAVGYDARETSRGFAEELARTLAGNGFDVLLSAEDCPTPVVGWTVRDRDLAGALMVTASHNPPEYNGVKFVPDEGAPALPEDTDRLEDLLAEPDPVDESEYGTITEEDLVEPYLEHALEYVDTDLSGLTVAYDAMHGSGREATPDLLERAGAEVTELRCSLDPEFGGTPPEPEAERLEELIDTVQAGEADLGIANDGDADRIAVVTPEAGFLDPSLQYAVLYDYLLEDDSGPAVRTVSTSSIIDKVARAHGEEIVETAVGFKWVAQAMKEHDALMGGEESGGFGLTDHLRNKDGVLIGLLAAAAEAEQSFDDRIAAIHDDHGKVHQDRISVACPDDRKQPVLDELDGSLPEIVAGAEVDRINTVDGFKITFVDDNWLLIRPSGTEPKLRVYAEADSLDRVEELLEAGRELVEPLV